MWKKIIFGIAISALIGGAIYWFTYTKELRTPVSEAINAIPTNAAIIFESKQIKNSWKKLSQGNAMWEELLGSDFFAKLNSQIRNIDSLIKPNAAISQLLDNRSLFISAHISGATTFDFLYVYSLPNRSNQSSVDGFIKSAGNTSESSYREYSGVDIVTIHPSKKDSLNYAFLNGILMMSTRQNLIEDAIRQIKSGTPLALDKNFSRVINTTGKNVDGNVYINYKNFPGLLSHFVAPPFIKDINSLADFADCSGWDITIKPNALMLNGFTQANDSSTNFLNLFKEQKTQEIEFTKIIPSKTALMIWFGISNVKTFHYGYKKYLKSISQTRTQNYVQYIESVNTKYSIDIEHSMLNWIDNEMALVVTEPSSADFSGNSYAVFHSGNIDDALKSLNGLADSISKREKKLPTSPKGRRINAQANVGHTIENRSSPEFLPTKEGGGSVGTYRNHSINYLNLPKLLPQLFGWQFNGITNNFFTSIEDYIVFANNKEALQNFIDDFENNKTEINDKNYLAFSENISTEANVYVYSSIARSTGIYSLFATEALAKDIEKKVDLFQKFEAVGIQFSVTKKLFYSTAYLKYNPKYKQESGTLWESKLDTTVSSKPQLIINHTTKAKEIIIQDDANKLYLISNTGKIIWKKQLHEKIMSDIIQVDVLKNNKLQMLFNTRSGIYIIDRNGKDMRGFPIVLESSATNGLSVIDYEKNRDYRIFVACENKRIQCFKSSGEVVKGFNFNKTNNQVTLPLQYVNIANKDLLCAIDKKGELYILNRQGEPSVKISEKLAPGIHSFYIERGKDLSKSFITTADTLGNIIRMSFTGNKQIIKTDDFDSSPFFDYKDINNDTIKEYIFLSRKMLKVFSSPINSTEPSLLFSYEFKENIRQAPLFFRFPDGKGKIGVLSEMTNELYLFNDNGTLYKGFPIEGKTPFCIEDLNNDGIYNIITGSDNTIDLYQLAPPQQSLN